MFNLKEDPFELVNLANNTRYRCKMVEINNELGQWIEKLEDSFSLPELETVEELYKRVLSE